MSKRILIVEEDVIGLNLLSQLLTYKGYEVRALHKSYRILNELAQCKPDVILLDEELCDMDSSLINRALKAIDTISEIPVMPISSMQYLYTNPTGEQFTNADRLLYVDALVQQIESRLAA